MATASHWETEGANGESFVTLNGTLMSEYMKTYNKPHSAFAPFALVAHDNAQSNPNAVFKGKPLNAAKYESAAIITENCPVQLFDASPTCDGAAAVVLTADSELARRGDGTLIEVLASAAATGKKKEEDEGWRRRKMRKLVFINLGSTRH